MMPRRPDKRSSFAQSFFQSTSDDDSLAEDNQAKSNDERPNFPVPPSRPTNRRSVSSAARRGTADSMSTSVAAAAAAVAAEAFDDDRDSWYADALRQQQGDEANLKAFLTDVTDDHQFGDREVLEQYRIMAQCEARLRVKENIGFDMEEYEATHKLENPEKTDKRTLFGGNKKSKFRLPEPTRPKPSSTKLEPEEPPILPPRPNSKLVQQKTKRVVPELQTGIINTSTSDTTIPADDHKVKCLGCRRNLQVNLMSTLVRCPECNVVSPASSTRR